MQIHKKESILGQDRILFVYKMKYNTRQLHKQHVFGKGIYKRKLEVEALFSWKTMRNTNAGVSDNEIAEFQKILD